ncbi:MAG: Sua5/YciO/YrdC/YwlC family protein [Planctomycetaceae bacterium]
MSDVLSIPPTGGSRADLRRLVDALVGGQLVALPSECGYLIAGSPLQPEATAALTALAPDGRLAVLTSEPELAEDFVQVENWTGPADRLASRCWPGPLVMEFPATESGTLINEWPEVLQRTLMSNRTLRLICSAQPLLQELGRELPWPLIVCASSRERPDERFDSVEVARERCGPSVALLVDSGPPRYPERSTVVHITADGWQILEEGIVGRRTVAQLASQIVLFTCTGNTCRSPMAEALFRKMLADRLNCAEDELTDRGYVVLSAGLATTAGMPASEHSVTVLGEEGIDLTGHHSQPAATELLSVADLIVTMTRSHRESIVSRFPELEPRVRLLSPVGRDVSDPFGGERNHYVRCRDEIREYLVQLIEDVCP